MAPRAGSSRGAKGGNVSNGRKRTNASVAEGHILARQQRRQANGGAASSGGPKSIHDVFEYVNEQAERADKGKGKGAQRRLLRAVANDGERRNGGAPQRDGSDEDGEEDNDGRPHDFGTAPKFGEDDSDGEGRAIASDDDEEIDSDEAFDESDEERYADWKFASKRNGQKETSARKVGGESDDDDEDEKDEDDDAGLMDLSKLLDGDGDSDGSSSDADDDDGDDEEENTERLQRHMDALLATNTKRSADDALLAFNVRPKRRVLQDRTEAIPEGEWNAPVGRSGTVLTLEDVMRSVSGEAGTSLTALRNNVESLRSAESTNGAKALSKREAVASKRGGGVLSAPLPTIVQDRLKRSAAYEDTKAEVQDWQPTIKRIREAQHLSFPLQPEPVMRPSTAALTANFTPTNAFEDDVAALLQREGLTEKQLAHAEELKMNERGMSADEVRQRTAELRRTRELLFREEQKAKRVSKIKSKTYRRIARKQRQRDTERAREAGVGGHDDEDAQEKADRERAEERATLKHKNAGKWAKGALKAKGIHDMPEAREAVNEQLARGEQLRRRTEKDDEDDSDEEFIKKTRVEHNNDDDDDDDSSSDGSVDARVEPMLISRHAGTAMQQRELVAEAFAGDDVMTDFAAEKAALIEAEAPQNVDTFLPGWGAWAGKGVRAPSKKQAEERKKLFAKTTGGLDPTKRKDAKLTNVIINQTRDKKADKYKSKDVPYPYTSRAQYEMAMRNPLGPEWNTRTQHQRLTLPRVVSKPGTVIRPIEKMF